jgi:hypothetical protein
MGCRLYVQDNTSHHPVRLPLSVQTTFYPAMIEAFLPARAFIRSGVFEQEVRFAVEDDCLEAPLVLPPGRCFASIELMLDGKLQRTPYLPLEIDTPIEAD